MKPTIPVHQHGDSSAIVRRPVAKMHGIFFMIVLLFIGFQQEAKAETWELENVQETYYDVGVSGVAIAKWPFSCTDLYVYTNLKREGQQDLPGIRVYSSSEYYLIRVHYKGYKENSVHTKAVLGFNTYGPYWRFDFDAPMLGAPSAETASTDQVNKITLSWKKSSSYAAADLQYVIREGSTVKATVDGTVNSYTITGLGYNEEHTYTITTRLKGSDRVSHPTTIIGKTFGFDLTATVDKVNSVELRWEKPADLTTEYIISRESTDLEQVGSSLDSYLDDRKMIPGVYMKYTIEAVDDASQKDIAYGRARPDGKISGSVTTPYGDPIGGVTIKIERTDLPNDTVQKVYYATTAHDDGSYFNETIYYGDEGAEFIVTPRFENHMFDPDTLTKTLSPNSPKQAGVNFKDTTALTVKGRILNKGCPAEGISILVNGIDRGYITNTDGYYAAVVDQPGIHTITPKHDGHGFIPEEYEESIIDNITGIDFEDTSRYVVNGYFSASCNTFIGKAELRFFSNGNCIDTTFSTTDTGYYEVKLPPGEYNIDVVSFTSADEGVVASGDVEDYFSQAMSIDLEAEAQYDSTKQIRMAENNFTYRLQPVLDVNILGRSESCGSAQIILEQNREYKLIMKVDELFNGASCHSESGYIVIEQDITSDNLEVDTIEFSGGFIDTMIVKIGVPNIIEPYMNTFRATAYVGNYSDVVEYDVIVVGHRPRSSTYTTVSPSIPFLILHDPPGDGSSSYMEESTSVNFNFAISMARENELRVYAGVKAGVEIIKGQFILSTTDQELSTEEGITVGIGISSESKFETSVTTTKKFSTSGTDDNVGAEGDVYFGGALNLIYALTDIIEYNSETCEVEKTVSLCMEPDGFATTFMYTENHIVNVEIPHLEMLRDRNLATSNDSALFYDKQISEWKQVVDSNHKNIEEAEFVENISISGGTEFSSSIESSSSFSQTIKTNLSIKKDAKIEFSLEESGSGFHLGLEHSFKFEIGTETSGGVSYKHTTGYTLSDDDDGDYMSIDILRDKVYGTPAFYKKAGTSSCPWEAGTQPREGVQIRAEKHSVIVDDPGGEAVFLLQLGNTSESDEDNSYDLLFDPTSNPDGAYVTIGGSPVVGNVPTPYDIPAGQSVQVTVTVKKGPYSSEFRDLKFILRSSCDGAIEDAVYLNAFFETDCGGINLTPENLVNSITQNSGQTVPVNISGYTRESLNSINLRIRTQDQDWSNLHILAGDNIGETETDLDLSFENLQDGVYYVEAVAMCSSDAVESETFVVTVDRTPPEVLFMSPYDGGIMQLGDEIAVSFNETINQLASGDISMMNLKSSTAVPFDFGCSETKVVILPSMESLLDGDSLEITISNASDIYGNMADPFSWAFSIPSVEEIFEDPMLDSDKDGVPNSTDICILVYNPGQEDMDEDGAGDECDDDIDGDGVLNISDNCPLTANVDQADADMDGIGDVCDEDMDGDRVMDANDNCLSADNPDQGDIDFDGLGDACDEDMDGDGINNDVDNCSKTANPNQTDSNGDGVGDACDGTGIAQLQNHDDIRVYPNPFDSELHFELQLEKPGRVKLELCNYMGQVVQNALDDVFTAGSYSETIKTAGLSSGVYFIRLTVDGKVRSIKIIKME